MINVDKYTDKFAESMIAQIFVKDQTIFAKEFVKKTYEWAESRGIGGAIAVWGSVNVLADRLTDVILQVPGKPSLEDVMSIFRDQPDEQTVGDRPKQGE